MTDKRKPVFYALQALAFAAFLIFFYLKYVPLLPPFQALFLPVLGAVAFLAAIRPRLATLVFIFFFPLVNHWPQLFGIGLTIPHAPAALVLCLFYLGGRLVHRAAATAEYRVRTPVAGPVAAAAGIVVLSAAVAIWRFANFAPFVSDRFYELATNVRGVTAGGAVMSTVFSSLNYLTGFAFFLFLVGQLRNEADRKSVLTALGSSLVLSLLFGFYQHFKNPGLGNSELWVSLKQINATFKDPNAFGAVLAMVIPLFLGAFFALRGMRKALAGAVCFLGLLIFPFIGVRSAFLGLVAALGWFAFFSFRSRRRALTAAGAVLIGLAVVAGTGYLTHSRLYERVTASLRSLNEEGGPLNLSPERYFLWKEAVGMTAEYPLTGVGAGAYIIELPNYYAKDRSPYAPEFAGFRRNDSAENYFLQVSSEMGLAGLGLFLWLFWVLGREVRHGFRRFRGRTESAGRRLLFIGGSAAMVAYGVNIIFHSYIGSFETNYMFWLIAGLTLYEAGRLDEPDRTPVPTFGSGRSRILYFAFIAVFAGISLWGASHSLSLAARTRAFGLRQAFGLYELERTKDGRPFHWTREYAGLPLKAGAFSLKIPVLATHPDIKTRPIQVEFFLVKGLFREKIPLGTKTIIDNDWKTFEIPIPGGSGPDGILLVKVSRTWNPLKTSGIPDPRELGVALGPIAYENE